METRRRTKYFEVTDDLLASQGQRFANYLIDYVIQILIGAGIGLLIGVYSNFTGNYQLLESLEGLNRIEEYALGIVILLFYYNITEIFLARSIGKFITKTIVVLEDGTKPDPKTILVRSLCRIIPFNQFSFLGSPSYGWHDSISDTYVVNKEELETKMRLFYEFEEIGSANNES
jgi:uncharacterized RDD family membrane protein YckC